MLDSLRSLGTRGSKLIRLDAFGYATKTPGTRCFFQVSHVALLGVLHIDSVATCTLVINALQTEEREAQPVCTALLYMTPPNNASTEANCANTTLIICCKHRFFSLISQSVPT